MTTDQHPCRPRRSTSTRKRILPPIERRYVNASDAAAYLGVSRTQFLTRTKETDKPAEWRLTKMKFGERSYRYDIRELDELARKLSDGKREFSDNDAGRNDNLFENGV